VSRTTHPDPPNHTAPTTPPRNRVDVRFEAKRASAPDLHAALSEWFPSGYSKTQPEFESAVGAALASDPAWGQLGRQLASEVMEGVEGGPRLMVRHVKLAEAPGWFKVRVGVWDSGWWFGRGCSGGFDGSRSVKSSPILSK